MRGGVTAPFLGLFENFGFLKKMIKLAETKDSGASMMSNIEFCQFWVFLTKNNTILAILWVFWDFRQVLRFLTDFEIFSVILVFETLKTPENPTVHQNTWWNLPSWHYLVILGHFRPFLAIFDLFWPFWSNHVQQNGTWGVLGGPPKWFFSK